MKKILAAVLALVLSLAIFGTAGADAEKRKVETSADADEFVAALLGAHPEEMDGTWAFSAQMEAAIGSMGGMAGLAKQLTAMGTPDAVLPAYEGEVRGMKAYFVPCAFSVMKADIVLVVQDGAVAGLSAGPYTGDRAETETESSLYDAVELPLPVPSLGELPGVLTLPKGEGPFPVIVLLHGSGSSDKDEAIGGVKPFRDLAEGLAAQGIAVYRFDKRNYVYGTELSTDKQFTPADEYLEDAVNAVQLLARQDRIDPDRIFVLGHSLGGNMIPAAARELENAPVKACGFIMMAASPRPMDVLMREQYEFLFSLYPEVTEEQQAEKDALFSELDTLKDVDALDGDVKVAGAYSAYWKWLAKYDILREADEITRPVLLLQGEEDYQVTMVDFGIWKEAFGEKGNWRMISYPGLTHPFTPGQKEEGSEIYLRSASVDEQVIRDIAAFVLEAGN